METVKVEELVKDKGDVSKKVKTPEVERLGKVAKSSPCKVDKKKVDDVKVAEVEDEERKSTDVTEMTVGSDAGEDKETEGSGQSHGPRPQLQYSKVFYKIYVLCLILS